MLSCPALPCASLTRRIYPEAGLRDSFGLANLRMNALEDRGYVPDCFPLDGDGRVQGGIGGGGDVDGVNADEAGGAHHLGKGECVALSPRLYFIGVVSYTTLSKPEGDGRRVLMCPPHLKLQLCRAAIGSISCPWDRSSCAMFQRN